MGRRLSQLSAVLMLHAQQRKKYWERIPPITRDFASSKRSTPLERIMREIRRRTRVVGAFPDGQSCLNLAAARLRYIAGTAWSAKCYMNMRPLYQPQVVQTEAVA